MDNRFIYDNENDIVVPKDTIICKDCIYRNKDLKDGFKRSRCIIYKDVCKPLGILFKDEKCNHYKKEKNLIKLIALFKKKLP